MRIWLVHRGASLANPCQPSGLFASLQPACGNVNQSFANGDYTQSATSHLARRFKRCPLRLAPAPDLRRAARDMTAGVTGSSHGGAE